MAEHEAWALEVRLWLEGAAAYRDIVDEDCIMAFVAPVVIALIISSVFGGDFMGSFSATYVVADEDQSELSRAFTEGVLGSPELAGTITGFGYTRELFGPAEEIR